MNSDSVWLQISENTIHNIEKMFGAKLLSVDTVRGGYSPTKKFKLTFKNAFSVFCKIDHLDNTAKGRTNFTSELFNYQNLPEIQTFAPNFLGHLSDGPHRLIFLDWIQTNGGVPPWTSEKVKAVIHRIYDLHSTPTPKMFPRSPQFQFEWQKNWTRLLNQPDLLANWFLLFSNPSEEKNWLDLHSNQLRDLDKQGASYDWDEVPIHLDLRSDNIVFDHHNHVLLLDWSYLTVGPRAVDFAFWLPSLVSEGGPSPEQALSEYEKRWKQTFDKAEILMAAVTVSGFFALNCHQPHLEALPHLRKIQRDQFFASFAWLKKLLNQEKIF